MKKIGILFSLFLLFESCSMQKVKSTALYLWNLKFSDLVEMLNPSHWKKVQKIYFTSEPAGALVFYKEGTEKKILGNTPCRVSFETNRDVLIYFRLTGYETKEITFNPTERKKLHAVLNKSKETHESAGGDFKFKMVFVEGGVYQMGDNLPMERKGYQPLRKVMVSSFYISRYELTYGEYDRYCKDQNLPLPDIIYDNPPRKFRPLGNVSWKGALYYCNWRSQKEGLTSVYEFSSEGGSLTKIHWNANGYRLPTEAEWEYAARGGQKAMGTLYAGSSNIDEVAWYEKNSDTRTHPVGHKKANELGIYDMSGNGGEICWDVISYKPTSGQTILTNPHGADTNGKRVYRGGNCYLSANYVRIPFRMSVKENEKTDSVGFRLVRSTTN